MRKNKTIELPKAVLSVDGCNIEIKTADITDCRAHWENQNIIIDYIKDFSLYKKCTDLIKHYFNTDCVMRWE